MSEETWVCDTCQHQIPKTSVFGFVGWMSDIARHVRECANPVAAQTENSSTEGRMRGGRGADTPRPRDRTDKEFDHDRF